MREFTLGSFARFTAETAALHEERLSTGVGMASVILEKEVRGTFGDASKLQDLATATQDERVKKGFTANDPLLRDGSLLRDSIERVHAGLIAGVGSAEPVMVFQELGTRRGIPPRPVFAISLKEAKEKIEAAIDMAVGVSIGAVPPEAIAYAAKVKMMQDAHAEGIVGV